MKKWVLILTVLFSAQLYAQTCPNDPILYKNEEGYSDGWFYRPGPNKLKVGTPLRFAYADINWDRAVFCYYTEDGSTKNFDKGRYMEFIKDKFNPDLSAPSHWLYTSVFDSYDCEGNRNECRFKKA